jgi:serine-threonine kinase receptor-associated protein
MATASGDFHVKVWDAVTGHCIWTFPHGHIVKTCDFTPDSTWLATGGHEGIVRIYNLVQQEELMMMTKTIKTTKTTTNQYPTTTSQEEVVVVPMEIRPEPLLQTEEVDGSTTTNNNNKIIIGKVNWYNNDIVLVGCSDGTVRIYNVRDSYNNNNNNHNNNNNPTSTTPIYVIRTNEDGAEIRDMELTTIQTPPTSTTTASTTTTTTPSPPPEIILSIASGNQVYFYNVTHLSNHNTVSSSSSSSSSQSPVLFLIHQYTMSKIHFRNEGGISLHPYGHRFIVGGNDLYVYVYNFHTGMEMECCKGHHGPIRCCRYSPNGGTMFASGSEDGTIRLWQDP